MGEKDPNKGLGARRRHRRLSSLYHAWVAREIPKLPWYGSLLQGEPIIASAYRVFSSKYIYFEVSAIESIYDIAYIIYSAAKKDKNGEH